MDNLICFAFCQFRWTKSSEPQLNCWKLVNIKRLFNILPFDLFIYCTFGVALFMLWFIESFTKAWIKGEHWIFKANLNLAVSNGSTSENPEFMRIKNSISFSKNSGKSHIEFVETNSAMCQQQTIYEFDCNWHELPQSTYIKSINPDKSNEWNGSCDWTASIRTLFVMSVEFDI